MLILTGVSMEQDRVRVFDTDDGAHEEVPFLAIVERLVSTNLTIYGLKKMTPTAFYPPDAKIYPQLGIAIVPSEAQEAMQRYKRSSGGGR